MKMSSADQTAFPKVKEYVENELPKIVDVPIIAKAMKKFGELDVPRLKKALKFGDGPMIKFVSGVNYCGEFTPGIKSNEIRINKSLAQDFEAGKGKEKAVNGKEVFVIGVTLLHELTHWGDDQDGKQQSIEEGEAFEKAIYGKIIPC